MVRKVITNNDILYYFTVYGPCSEIDHLPTLHKLTLKCDNIYKMYLSCLWDPRRKYQHPSMFLKLRYRAHG